VQDGVDSCQVELPAAEEIRKAKARYRRETRTDAVGSSVLINMIASHYDQFACIFDSEAPELVGTCGADRGPKSRRSVHSRVDLAHLMAHDAGEEAEG